LRESGRPLVEVAQYSGFSDQAAFSRTFKAVVGRSPGKWRREARSVGLSIEMSASGKRLRNDQFEVLRQTVGEPFGRDCEILDVTGRR
jgi:AraC-like DNA-binding protein